MSAGQLDNVRQDPCPYTRIVSPGPEREMRYANDSLRRSRPGSAKCGNVRLQPHEPVTEPGAFRRCGGVAYDRSCKSRFTVNFLRHRGYAPSSSNHLRSAESAALPRQCKLSPLGKLSRLGKLSSLGKRSPRGKAFTVR